MQMPKSLMIVSALIGVLMLPVTFALGQATCEAFTSETFAALNEACGDAPLDSVCAVSGEVSTLDAISSTDETAVILLSGTDENNPLKVYLLGGAALTAYEQGVSSSLLEIGNRAGYNVNLRAGAGSNFDVVGIFRYNERLNADGQSADGQWLRVVLADGGVAWVGTSLVAVAPAIAELPVVDQNTSTAVGHTLTISTPDADQACDDALIGALITSSSDSAQTVTVNGVRLSLENGAIIAEIHADATHFYALNGVLKLNNQAVELGAVRAADTLEDVQAFPALEVIQSLPLEGELALCLVQSEADLDAFTAPAATESPVTLAANGSYPVVAQTSVEDVQWGQLGADFDGLWVNLADVTTFGACEALPEANVTSGNNAGSVTAAADAGVPPHQIMMSYLSARVVGDGARMQQLACTAFDGQAAIQSQSFRAMRAELQNVACSTTQESATSATVFCSGHIQTEYNGAFRQWELGSYNLTRENGAWRMCGESN